ncbi:EexN family lipoprotein [Ancylobacter oerskovii]|uniref:EexN family lipoprotein n=1 Tax=Ancylobacter oerskovii TaxID=459519 RepID=A0ABW4Z5G4_9HYPH|nr:EexN family lipoprotein [Ancylobacter oerskovii]MBS7545518.1 EexN family lipoprotein [Ancylobacter oerskovii]
MKQALIIGLLTATALLGGCGSEPERSYEWYVEHQAEAKAKAVACSEMSEAKAALDGNCARARKAYGTLRSVPVEFGPVN